MVITTRWAGVDGGMGNASISADARMASLDAIRLDLDYEDYH
jgi:hypothetical protein